VQVLSLDEMKPVQRIEVPAFVLDVAFCNDIMYVSLDVSESSWIVEYTYKNEWRQLVSDRWKPYQRDSSPADLYWLEDMRKKVGQIED
jgi:hypothetical protein